MCDGCVLADDWYAIDRVKVTDSVAGFSYTNRSGHDDDGGGDDGDDGVGRPDNDDPDNRRTEQRNWLLPI